jgi:hypothetical protein
MFLEGKIAPITQIVVKGVETVHIGDNPQPKPFQVLLQLRSMLQVTRAISQLHHSLSEVIIYKPQRRYYALQPCQYIPNDRKLLKVHLELLVCHFYKIIQQELALH